MGITREQVTGYLDRYASTLTGFDAPGAAKLWSTPGTIVDDRFSGVLDSREKMIEGLQQSYPLYRKLDLGSVAYDLVEQTQLSEALVLVRVRWMFLDDSGAELTDSTSCYLLREEEAGLRACVWIETDSAEKIRALAAERGVDLTQQDS